MKKNEKISNNKVPERIQQKTGDSFNFSTEHLSFWAKQQLIPRELAMFFLKKAEGVNKQYSEIEAYKKKNPNATTEQMVKDGLFELKKTKEEVEIEKKKIVEFHNFIKENWDELTKIFPLSPKPQLYENIDLSKYFGISGVISNSLYHLESLLGNMELDQIRESVYEAKGKFENSIGDSINLVYSFQASSKKEAEKVLVEYKKLMHTKGLNLWLGYWLMANKKNKTEYSCAMTDIMKLVSNKERSAFFSVKEKEEHWAITKILSMSKLLRSREIKKKGTNKQIKEWIEQPLVEIIGGEKELTDKEKYPTSLNIRVMSSIGDKKIFSPNSYHNNTVTLGLSDTFLAFKTQTRANQRERGKKLINLDWDFVFRAGNLKKTAITKKAAAKTKARKKLDRLKKNKIIADWNEHEEGISITPTEPFKKEKNKENST